MSELFSRRPPKHRRKVEPARPTLRLPLADPSSESMRDPSTGRRREAQRREDDEEPERGVAVIDFFI